MVLSHLQDNRRLPITQIPEIVFCPEKNRLQKEFLKAIHELSVLHSQQTQAVIDGDEDFGRFDILLHLAQEKKDQAKYTWIAHVEQHGCQEGRIEPWDSLDSNGNESGTAD
jgi:hypothetical protein